MALNNQIGLAAMACAYLCSLSACNASFMKSAPRSKTASLADLTTSIDAAGNVSAAFDPNSTSVQVLRLTSGSLAGSGVALPPGSLSIPVSITVGEGETLASTGFTQQLGLGSNAVTAAGPSVSFIPSTNVQASSPFTLSIPFSRTSLTLTETNSDNIIVMYRWMKVSGDEVTYEMGIIPRSDVTVSSSKVSFGTTKFGVFQIGVSDTKIEERIKVPSAEPPALKADAGNPLVGSWGECHKDGASASTVTTNTPTTTTTITGSTTNGTTGPIPDVCTTLNFGIESFGRSDQPLEMKLTFIGSIESLVISSPGISIGANGQPLRVFDVPAAMQPGGKIITAWAPNGCYFKSPNSTPERFQALGLQAVSDNTYPMHCKVDTSNTQLVCDGTAGTMQLTDQKGESHFGYVPGVTYSTFGGVKFTNNAVTHIKQIFDGADCKGNLVATMTETGSYELPPVDVAGTLPINITRKTKVGTIFSPASINAANKDPNGDGCGFSDWVVGVKKDLADSPCAGTRNTEYTRIKIDGSKLYFCDNDSATVTYGDSEATRVPSCDNLKPDKFLQKK